MPSWVLRCLEGQTPLQIAGFRGRCSAEGLAGAEAGEHRFARETARSWPGTGCPVCEVVSWLWFEDIPWSVAPAHGTCWIKLHGHLPTGSVLTLWEVCILGLKLLHPKAQSSCYEKNWFQENVALSTGFSFNSNPNPQWFQRRLGNGKSVLNSLQKVIDHTQRSYTVFSVRLTGKLCDRIECPRVPFMPLVWRENVVEFDA